MAITKKALLSRAKKKEMDNIIRKIALRAQAIARLNEKQARACEQFLILTLEK